jgi:hypothetical protein
VVSLRSAAVALVASAAILGVLVGVTTAEFTVPSQDPPIDPADQQVTAQQHSPVGPPIMAPQPKPVDPPVTAPQPNPGPPPAPPQPNSVDRPVAVARTAPIRREPVVHPVADRQAPVNAQPVPAAPPPAPDAPAKDHQAAYPPPSSASPARNSKSRTVNTEPCACDGKMRQVHTHWDPPEG